MSKKKQSQNNYDEDNIQVLSDIKHIQLRKGMYIGEAENAFQLFSEILDNSLDELGEGYGEEIKVIIDTKLNKYTIMDQGRGIPIGLKTLETGEQKEILEVICTKANSSGKFNTNSYKYSAGINGLGITITNALSEYFEITTMREGKAVTFKAKYGEKESLNYDKISKSKHGTTTSFIPDPKMFKSTKIPLEKIIDRCRVASALGYRVRLIVDEEEIETSATIYDLITEPDETITTYKELPLIISENENKELMKVAIRYTSDTHDRYFGYTNMLTNSSGGTHVNELSKTIISAWQEFVDKKKIKLEVNLKPNDYLLGLRAVCAIFISQPEFSSQTKEKLVIPKDRLKELMEGFKIKFKEILYKDQDITLALIKRFTEYRIAQNKLLMNKDIMSKIKINEDGSNNIRRRSVVEKLVECTSRKREGTEIIYFEGDSAASLGKVLRNKEWQSILPLRGKVLNVAGKSVKDSLKSQPICDIANSAGCGIGGLCDPSKRRYEKLLIAADSDPDGKQIYSLILNVFINLFPDLVKAGAVYVILPPLYSYTLDKNRYYTNHLDEVPKNANDLVRFKGLGEMGQDDFYNCILNPKKRKTYRVEYPADLERFNQIMGTREAKRELLEELGIMEEIN